MSLITCCPACGTMFKVVADQLRISEGWVRCGHCTEVFDATAHMRDPAPEEPEDVGPEIAEPEVSQPEVSQPQVAAPVAVERPEPVAQATPRAAPAAVAEEAPAPVSAPLPDDSGYPPFELRRPDFGDVELTDSVFPPVIDSSWDPPKPADRAPLDSVGFVREAQRKAFWRRPGVRVMLVLLGVVLLVLLAAQVAVQERDRLAALRPGLRPLLQTLCQPFDCDVGPMKRIEAVSIDSSAFNKLRPDLYRLNFTLKNQGRLDVAMPALQLTLTDVQDQPVVQRVLGPRELGASSEVIAGDAEWSGSIILTVNANGSTARIAGYRLWAFYP